MHKKCDLFSTRLIKERKCFLFFENSLFSTDCILSGGPRGKQVWKYSQRVFCTFGFFFGILGFLGGFRDLFRDFFFIFPRSVKNFFDLFVPRYHLLLKNEIFYICLWSLENWQKGSSIGLNSVPWGAHCRNTLLLCRMHWQKQIMTRFVFVLSYEIDSNWKYSM